MSGPVFCISQMSGILSIFCRHAYMYVYHMFSGNVIATINHNIVISYDLMFLLCSLDVLK